MSKKTVILFIIIVFLLVFVGIIVSKKQVKIDNLDKNFIIKQDLDNKNLDNIDSIKHSGGGDIE